MQKRNIAHTNLFCYWQKTKKTNGRIQRELVPRAASTPCQRIHQRIQPWCCNSSKIVEWLVSKYPKACYVTDHIKQTTDSLGSLREGILGWCRTCLSWSFGKNRSVGRTESNKQNHAALASLRHWSTAASVSKHLHNFNRRRLDMAAWNTATTCKHHVVISWLQFCPFAQKGVKALSVITANLISHIPSLILLTI